MSTVYLSEVKFRKVDLLPGFKTAIRHLFASDECALYSTSQVSPEKGTLQKHTPLLHKPGAG